MQSYVKGRDRAASPQHAQDSPRINPSRQAIAANAKISMRKGTHPQQLQQAPTPSGIPSRGFGNTQNTSAAMQHAPQRRYSGQGQKHDVYDTDAESIDTTVNHSIIQTEDRQQAHQREHQQHGHIVDLSEDTEEDEEGDDEHEVEDEFDENGFTEEEVLFLQQEGMEDYDRKEQLRILSTIGPRRGLRTVDGDSYPSTTDGNPTEWEGVQEPAFEEYDDGGPVSPSPRHLTTNGHRPPAPPPIHRGYRGVGPVTGHPMDNLFKQSANLRDQQRLNTHHGQQSAHTHQSKAAPLVSSQLFSYSQASRGIPPTQPVHPQPQLNHHVAFNQPQQPILRPPSGPARIASQPPKSFEAPVPAPRPSSARIKVVPIIQHPLVEPQQAETAHAHPNGDYDIETLHAMSYDQLKNESFDTNPQANAQPLSEEMLQKPLVERLDHVQKNFEPEVQAHFFQSLSTTEWEDAGDWFLDQFSSIIQRTKEARQKKRKLAQEFENEVEKRNKYVSKKQRQVEHAMSNMKAHGEGLVPKTPKSPRTSKSPKPRKG